MDIIHHNSSSQRHSSPEHVGALADLGSALKESVRVGVLLELCQGKACSSELANTVGVTRQVMSNHLAALKDSGLVSAQRQGRHVFYELSSPHLAHALEELLIVTLAINPSCCSNVVSAGREEATCQCLEALKGGTCDD